MLLKNKEEIKGWLDYYYINNYEIIEDQKYGNVVNINNHLNLVYKGLKNIEVKFNEINGGFYCDDNKLESLKGAPNIVRGDFFACRNKIKSMINCSKIIKGKLNLSLNDIKTLKGCPNELDDALIIENNLLTIDGLKYLPKKINNNKISFRDNYELGHLEKINNFEELKKQVDIYFEKEKLLKIINKKNSNIKNTKIIKI